MALRYSKQREVIARNLKNREDHPSADMVYASVKEQIPRISLGTVYRNLKDMTAGGEAISFMVNGKEHFDGRNQPHIHLCCRSCSAIIERFVSEEQMEAIAGEDFAAENIVVQGLCKECQKSLASDRSAV